jgi:DNA-binding response OmpR family regulator
MAMDVALIQWPSDEGLRLDLATRYHPRLLLVEPDADPPECTDPLEDWVRLPVSRADRDARIRSLESRVEGGDTHGAKLDDDGILEYRGKRIQLSATQTNLVRLLIERCGAVVGREALANAAWPDAEPSDNNLDVTMGRLRRRLATAELRIRTVRSRGYFLSDDAGDR